MSIAINKNGELVITASGAIPVEDHVNRMKAIISLVQQRSDDFLSPDEVYAALDLLEDMLPDEQQLKKALM